jgi:hypothetical protein
VEVMKLPIRWIDGEVITFTDLQQITVLEFTQWKRQVENTPRRAIAGDPAELRAAKKAAGLTFPQIAQALGIGERMVYKMFAGEPSEKAGALRELLEISPYTPEQMEALKAELKQVSPPDPLK